MGSKIDFQDRIQNVVEDCKENGQDLTIRWVTSDGMWYADLEETHGGDQLQDFEAETLETLIEDIESWLEIN